MYGYGHEIDVDRWLFVEIVDTFLLCIHAASIAWILLVYFFSISVCYVVIALHSLLI